LLKSIEDINTTKKRLRIEIPTDVIEKEIGCSLEKLRQRVKIPGFRQGKAPMNLLEKRFGKEIEAEVLEKIIPEYYSIAIKEAAIKPVTLPVLDEEIEFKRNAPLNLSFTVEVLPKIGNINYENIKIKDIQVKVEEADIEAALKKLQERKAVFEVAEKEIDMDDLVTFDYVDSKIVSGENVSSLKDLISNMGNEILPPDIIEKVIGKKKDDIIEFNTTFDENFKHKEIAGKTANIKLLIKEVKKKNLPAMDDEFAKDLGFGTISELRENLKERIHKFKKDQAQKIQKAEIVRQLIESTSFEVPETMLQQEIESLMIEGKTPETSSDEENTEAIPESDITDSETDLSDTEQKKDDIEDMPAKIRNRALKNVHASIIIDLIGQKEGIKVTDDEVNEHISLIASTLSTSPEAIKNFYQYREGSLESVRRSLYEEKVLDLLLSKAIMEREETT
jgi:trigger factor